MAKNQSKKWKKIIIEFSAMWFSLLDQVTPNTPDRMTTMSEVFLWNYPGLWNCILMCPALILFLDSFKVQFSHQIFSVFNQISFLVTQCADFGDFLHSKQAIKQTLNLSWSQTVPFPQFQFTCLVLAFILWVFCQTLIYFRIYRKFLYL